MAIPHQADDKRGYEYNGYDRDRDPKTFTIEGPMQNDTSWNNAVCTAQAANRKVNYHTPGGDARSNVELAAQIYSKSFPEMPGVKAGTIDNLGSQASI